jgi:hypothetical protein
MNDDAHATDALTIVLRLEQVQQQFESWRKHRKKRTRIPQRLWKAAVSLSDEHSIHHLSKILRINYTALKNRVLQLNPPAKSESYVSNATFFELPTTTTLESTIEMVRADGAVMKMHLKSAGIPDLVALGKAFLAGGA